ncbi:MAG: bifunctional RNase H/acid phosphatase [Angustibacter sp.]
MSRRFVVEADGGARGNPGPAGYGAVVRDADTGHVLVEAAESIGQATNNVAEYRGLVAGLTAAVELDSDCTIEVRMDSKLVVEQMSGRWQIKHADMRRLAAQAREVVDPERVRYTWIPREKNKAADRLANEAMDDAAKGRPWRGLLRSQAVQEIEAEDAEPRTAAERPVAPPAPRADVGPGAELVLLRHGVTEHTSARRYSGRGGDDLGLTDLGRQQAVAAAAALAADGPFDAVLCSPLRRTQETAQVVADRLGVPVRVDDDWVECSFGAWDGLTAEEVSERWPAEHAAWFGSVTAAPPGGESLADLEVRVLRGRDRLLARFPRGRVLVVTHASPIKSLTRAATGAAPDVLWRLESSPASITRTRWWSDGGSVLVSFNETAHLQAAGIALR